MATSNPIAYHLLFIFGATLACVFLGITPMFGAFLAGIAASVGHGPRVTHARESIKSFSFAFFIPVYFAIVGLQLDLVRHFDLLFFTWFLLFACAAKAASVYLGPGWEESPRGRATSRWRRTPAEVRASSSRRSPTRPASSARSSSPLS